VELLKQNLVVESDLQNFSGFVLESVAWLKGSTFTATLALLGLMQELREAGATSGFPLPVALVLEQLRLAVRWNEWVVTVVELRQAPPPESIEDLQQYLQNSTLAVDPDILLQRNAEMLRHFDEVRARNERELEDLQKALAKGRSELEKLAHQAETDPLTGLYNRRAFDARLEQAFRHTMRQRRAPLSLLFFDLDHFKQVNDEFGHQHGDTYLNRMAQVLRGIIREDVDFAFRFGGDEFAVVLFADYPQACEKARQALQLMEGKVSVGITAINSETPNEVTLQEFIHHADHALYEAKHRGRGRVITEICECVDSSGCPVPCPRLQAA
jgi:diguanylate cyclase (GGDEF)-like protein